MCTCKTPRGPEGLSLRVAVKGSDRSGAEKCNPGLPSPDELQPPSTVWSGVTSKVFGVEQGNAVTQVSQGKGHECLKSVKQQVVLFCSKLWPAAPAGVVHQGPSNGQAPATCTDHLFLTLPELCPVQLRLFPAAYHCSEVFPSLCQQLKSSSRSVAFQPRPKAS